MSDPLRDRRAVRELAANEQVIEISNKVGDFERLARAIEQDLSALPEAERPAGWREAAVRGRLAFGFAGGGDRAARLEGRAATTVAGVCQRCLAPFEWTLDVPLRLQFAEAERPEAECEGFELWELDDTTVSPLAVVDEALVMALPLSAMHADSARCVEIAPQESGEEKTRPFAALRARMDENQD